MERGKVDKYHAKYRFAHYCRGQRCFNLRHPGVNISIQNIAQSMPPSFQMCIEWCCLSMITPEDNLNAALVRVKNRSNFDSQA